MWHVGGGACTTFARGPKRSSHVSSAAAAFPISCRNTNGVSAYQRRLVRSYLPLFPGYVFVVGNENDGEAAADLKELVGILKVDDQRQIESELRNIHCLLRAGLPVTREERLQPGSLAKIVSGPLAGLCGQVIKNRQGLRFVLHVQFLQQGVSLEVDGSVIEAL